MPLFWGFFAYLSGLAALLIAGFLGVQTVLSVPTESHIASAPVAAAQRPAGLPPIIQPIVKAEVAPAPKAATPHFAQWAKKKAHGEISAQRRRHAQHNKSPAIAREDARNAFASGVMPSQAPDTRRIY